MTELFGLNYMQSHPPPPLKQSRGGWLCIPFAAGGCETPKGMPALLPCFASRHPFGALRGGRKNLDEIDNKLFAEYQKSYSSVITLVILNFSSHFKNQQKDIFNVGDIFKFSLSLKYTGMPAPLLKFKGGHSLRSTPSGQSRGRHPKGMPCRKTNASNRHRNE